MVHSMASGVMVGLVILQSECDGSLYCQWYDGCLVILQSECDGSLDGQSVMVRLAA